MMNNLSPEVQLFELQDNENNYNKPKKISPEDENMGLDFLLEKYEDWGHLDRDDFIPFLI